MHINQKIGRVIKLARTQQGIAQGDLAETLGISQGLLSNYENGRINFSINTLEKIFNALGMDVEVLGKHRSPPAVTERLDRLEQMDEDAKNAE